MARDQDLGVNMKRNLNSLKETWPEGDGDICVSIIQGNGTATDTEKNWPERKDLEIHT